MVGQLYQRSISNKCPVWEVTSVEGEWAYLKNGDFKTRLPISVLTLWYMPIIKEDSNVHQA